MKSRLVAIAIAIALVTPAARTEDAKPPAGFTALFNGKDINRLEGSHYNEGARHARSREARGAARETH